MEHLFNHIAGGIEKTAGGAEPDEERVGMAGLRLRDGGRHDLDGHRMHNSGYIHLKHRAHQRSAEQQDRNQPKMPQAVLNITLFAPEPRRIVLWAI
jgi:hypothetical protein